jgi:hypothetical protein
LWLLGGALALVGVEAVETARRLENPSRVVARALGGEVGIVAQAVSNVLVAAGTLVGLAAIAYVVALHVLGQGASTSQSASGAA